jgi:hypothetical protein
MAKAPMVIGDPSYFPSEEANPRCRGALHLHLEPPHSQHERCRVGANRHSVHMDRNNDVFVCSVGTVAVSAGHLYCHCFDVD